MSKISDELRERGNGYYEQRNGDCEWFNAIADRIDAEMVELPKDADGVPIHVGDTVYLEDGRKAEVDRIDLMPTKTCICCWTSDKKDVAYLPHFLSHTAQDSLERIAEELEAWCDDVDVDGDACDTPRVLAERIRKLAKEQDDE